MCRLKAGVIGLGMGKVHAAEYARHPKVELAAVADLDESKIAMAKDEYGVERVYTDAEEMLEKEALDVVSICTPNFLHAPLAKRAFERGMHVLCEKPPAMNAVEAREMVDAAEKAGRRLMINFSYRFTDQSMALKKEVESGILGDVYFVRTVWHRRRGVPKGGGWFCSKEASGGGPLIDLGVHRVDLALWLMGYPEPEWVLAGAYDRLARRLADEKGWKYDVEDMAVGFVKFKNGASMVVEASWLSNRAEKEYMVTRLYGTEGGLVQRNVGEGYEFEAEIYVERNGSQFDVKLHPPVPGVQSPMHHFIDCILNDEPHEADGEEGVVIMKILDAVYRSAAEGGPVRVP